MAKHRYCMALLLFLICGCHTSQAIRTTTVPASEISKDTSSTAPGHRSTRAIAWQGHQSSVEADSVEIQQTSGESTDSPLSTLGETQANDIVEGGVPSSLISAVSMALNQNPDLVALRETEPVGVAVYGVASTYPFNPFLQVQATPYQDQIDGRTGKTSHYVLLMQRIQLAHQQQHREDAALSSLNGVRWNIHQAELQTVSLTARLYFAVLYQRGLLEVARDSQENNDQLFEVLSKRFAAGDASAADMATVRIDTQSTRQQLRLAEANYRSAIRDLLRQIGMPIDSPFDFEGDIRLIRWRLPHDDSLSFDPLSLDSQEPSLEVKAWVANWASSRPDVLAAQAGIDVARANLRLATADRVPDVQVGPYYQLDPDGQTRLGFRADLNLPVINTGKPLESQRVAEYRQRITVWQQTVVRAELEAQAAYERYELAYQLLETESANGNDPAEMPRELRGLERQFRAGEVDVVRIIQARTSILQNQRARLDLLNELAQAAALLVGASGISLELMTAH